MLSACPEPRTRTWGSGAELLQHLPPSPRTLVSDCPRPPSSVRRSSPRSVLARAQSAAPPPRPPPAPRDSRRSTCTHCPKLCGRWLGSAAQHLCSPPPAVSLLAAGAPGTAASRASHWQAAAASQHLNELKDPGVHRNLAAPAVRPQGGAESGVLPDVLHEEENVSNTGLAVRGLRSKHARARKHQTSVPKT